MGSTLVVGESDATWGSPIRPYAGGTDVFVAWLGDGQLSAEFLPGIAGSRYCRWYSVIDYVIGSSAATWGTPVSPFSGGTDVFVAHLDDGPYLSWSTFMGSAGADTANGVAADGSGNLYITGTSDATWGTPIHFFAGGTDAFAAWMDNSGSLQRNTFMGSAGSDEAAGIAVSGTNVYVTGCSTANWGAPSIPYTGGTDAFLARFGSGSILNKSTFLGGAGNDCSTGIAVNGSGGIYVAGTSSATWGTPLNPFAGGTDGFVALRH